MNSEIVEKDRLGQEERDISIIEGKKGKFSPVSKKPESLKSLDEGEIGAAILVSSSSVGFPFTGRLEIPDQLRSRRSTFGSRLANHAPSLIPLQPLSLSILILASAPRSEIVLSTSSVISEKDRSRKMRRGEVKARSRDKVGSEDRRVRLTVPDKIRGRKARREGRGEVGTDIVLNAVGRDRRLRN